jgi:FMN phosphatase YigB (HAD superfamily)
MEKILLTDVDDVLVRWSKHFRQVFKKETGHTASVKNAGEGIAYGHLDQSELERHITNFNLSEHFENLKPKANSEIILPKLKSEGWTIIGITACGRDPEVQKLRWKNLNKIYGEGVISDIHFINWYECKSSHLADYANCPFVDDNIKHAETAHRMGHRAMIMHRCYRRKFKHREIPYVMDWDEIYEEISK